MGDSMPYRTGGYQGDYTGGYQGDPQLGGLLTLGARLAGRGIRGLLGRISGRSLVRAGAATTAVAAVPVAGRIGRGIARVSTRRYAVHHTGRVPEGLPQEQIIILPKRWFLHT